MTTADDVPAATPATDEAVPVLTGLAGELATKFGAEVRLTEEFGDSTIDVPAAGWVGAVEMARDGGFAFFDWLSAVDELEHGFNVVVCLWRLPAGGGATRGTASTILLRTRVAREAASLPTLTGIFAGAGWAERETFEMFGIDFVGHPYLAPLLLPENFEGNPLRKEFVLAARATRPWPGAKEPGESDADLTAGSPPAGARPAARRRVVAPGVPDASWGPRPASSGEPEN